MSDNFNDSLVAVLPRLRTLALALTSNRPDAEDLVHDAVTNALAARDSFEPGSNFSAWIYRIMRNRFLSIVRKRRPTSSIEEVSGGRDVSGGPLRAPTDAAGIGKGLLHAAL